MEKEELQQLVSKDNEKEFFQELFKELVCIVIPQHLRSRTKSIMKWKGKAPIKDRLKNLQGRKCLKQKRAKKCCNGWRWIPMNSNELDELVGGPTYSGLCHERTCCEIFYEPWEQWRMEESKGKCMVKKIWLIRYLFMNNLGFPRKE